VHLTAEPRIYPLTERHNSPLSDFNGVVISFFTSSKFRFTLQLSLISINYPLLRHLPHIPFIHQQSLPGTSPTYRRIKWNSLNTSHHRDLPPSVESELHRTELRIRRISPPLTNETDILPMSSKILCRPAPSDVVRPRYFSYCAFTLSIPIQSLCASYSKR